jgi:hypothetical protein
MIAMEQNELYNGNNEWVYTIQIRAWSGITCEYISKL